ncbi:MAG: hypothetical protein EXS18_06125 [Verrucomicrobiae bacterium]|nr:hypothetical protein [Verrucomicrobiae bacterium]
MPAEKINDERLLRGLDVLLAHKGALSPQFAGTVSQMVRGAVRVSDFRRDEQVLRGLAEKNAQAARV